MLAGVDYRVAASHLADAAVKLSVVADVLVQCAPKTRRQHRSGQQRHEPVAVNFDPEAGDAGRVDSGPAAESDLAHLPPELTRGERQAASAALIVNEAPLPNVNDLAEGAHPGHFAEEPLDERAPAASKSGQVDDPGCGLASGGGLGDRACCGS